MAKVNVSEAIRLSGVSRSTFYTRYVSTGQISVETAHDGKKQIDTADLLRVFGSLQTDPGEQSRPDTGEQVCTPEDCRRINTLEIELKHVREQLQDAREQLRTAQEREERQAATIDRLTTFRQLTDNRKSWWQRFTGQG